VTESRRILAILAYDSGTAPTMSDFADVIRDQRYSLRRYWQDNASGVISIDQLDLAGPYLVSPPAFTFNASGNPVSPGRATTVDVARAAAQRAGVDLSPYDATFVVLSPGFQVVNGANLPYDGGTDPTLTKCLVMITDSLTIFEHELGHVLGFTHTQGALTGTNAAGSPVWDYGDPYDIMSAETFGFTSPTMTAAGTPTATYPASARVGPMLSRAELYRAKQQEMEALGNVLQRTEGGNTSVQLYPAGTGAPGRPELLVYTTSQSGKIYVEFRAPGPESAGNWWDSGLQDPAQGGGGNVPAALVVHYLAPNANGKPATWFAGRIAFPDADRDTTFSTPDGTFTVTVTDAQHAIPDRVAFTITRGRPAQPSVMVYESTVNQVTVTASEKRINPRYPDAGPFTWEKRTITRTTTYVPRVLGIGFGWANSITAHSDISVQWSTGDGTGTIPAGTATTHSGVRCTPTPDTGVLTVSNDPAGGHVAVTLTATAIDQSTGASNAAPATADVQFEVTSPVEGWGNDFMQFLLGHVHDLLNRKWGLKLGPIEVGPLAEDLDQLRRIHTDLSRLVLEQATQLHPVALSSELDLSQHNPGSP
jgi:hypothetical protein